ncbi:MAG: ATP-binding protein [Verrucomicrobiales bacterium]|nr:ATP-binding protein [Verrucomicrobiales bacterium]
MNFLKDFLEPGAFMPHGHCYFWTQSLITLHTASDALIVLAYYSIPLTLVYFVRKRQDLEFDWMFVCFAVFILACGTTHLMEIWNVWHASYWLSGSVKALTALASVPTAILLVKLVPQALTLPSPSELRRVNEALQGEIAERKRFERALRDKNAELEMASQSKDRFLATMSHELRTPLNAVLGFTGTLLMKLPGPLNADQERQLRTVQRNAKHLLALINDLLDLAKIESGKVELDLEPVVCQSVLQDVAAALRPAAEGKGLRFEVNAPPSGTVVQTDRRALNQILLNLASNAIKFTERGSVCLELTQRREGDRTLTEISVADTGIGIRVEDQAKLFQAFAQVGARGRRDNEGTGLGLHLSQKLVELLGGGITFQSEHGAGSTFTVVLPSNPGAASPQR